MQVTEIYKTLDYSPAPESPEQAIEWLKENKSSFGLFINGKWRKPKSAAVFKTVTQPTEKN